MTHAHVVKPDTSRVVIRYFIDPTRRFFSRESVKTSVLGKLRVPKQSTEKAIPLDSVSEHYTERCSLRFPPSDLFWSQLSDTCCQIGKEKYWSLNHA